VVHRLAATFGRLAPVYLAGGGSIDEFHELADLFVSRDVPALADALARFIEDETLRKRLAKGAASV
jgi:hypothetical protein